MVLEQIKGEIIQAAQRAYDSVNPSRNFGRGICGKVADNIEDVLRDKGISAVQLQATIYEGLLVSIYHFSVVASIEGRIYSIDIPFSHYEDIASNGSLKIKRGVIFTEDVLRITDITDTEVGKFVVAKIADVA